MNPTSTERDSIATPGGDTTTAEAPTDSRAGKIAVPLLLTLALLSAIAPFATDLYLPAFPQMTTDLSTSDAGVQLSLTTFLIGAGIGQLVFGPLSDRIGRRPPLLFGVVLFLITSLASAFAPSIGLLVAFRLLQGIAGAAGMVIARAIVADQAHGSAGARAQTMMMMVSGVAPVVAPLTGSFLADTIGWRGLLGIVAGIGAIAVLATLLTVRETRPREKRHAAGSVKQELASDLRVLRSRRYIGHAVSFAFAFAVMMAYISASPFVYQEMIGLSTIGYGLAFGFNALLLMVSSAIAARLTGTMPARRIAGVGLAINLAAVISVAAIAFAGLPTVVLVVPLAIAIGSLGLVFGSTTALALDDVPEAPGMASAVLGMGQFALAGLVAPLVSLGGESTAVPLAVVMLVSSLISIVALRFAGRSADTLDA